MTDRNFREIESFVKRVRTRRDPAHGWRHIQQLISFCKEVGPAENADMWLLLHSAYFHGLWRQKHLVPNFLKSRGYNVSLIQKILRTVRNSGINPRTKEEKILHDANIIDAIEASKLAVILD